jgi:murein L,D-transpeptidase YafK
MTSQPRYGDIRLVAACARPAPVPPGEPPAPVPQAVLEPRPPLPCERIVRIEVRKHLREFEAQCARGAVVTMAVALGREPSGAKRERGDLRTPEGAYRVAGGRRESRFHGFIPLDYPSVSDADEALGEHRIGPRDHARILDTHARGVPPPGDTPLGGDIGIHGEGSRWRGESRDLDWTYGCLAVSDDDLDFLADRVSPGVPVVILP